MDIKFDTYSFRARILPVYLTLAPAVLLVAALVPDGLKLPLGGAAAIVFVPISFFFTLRRAPIRLSERHRIRDFAMSAGHRSASTGTISRLEDQHGFVQKDGSGDQIFFHRRQQGESVWESLQQGARIAFEVGFSFGGPEAVRINVL